MVKMMLALLWYTILNGDHQASLIHHFDSVMHFLGLQRFIEKLDERARIDDQIISIHQKERNDKTVLLLILLLRILPQSGQYQNYGSKVNISLI